MEFLKTYFGPTKTREIETQEAYCNEMLRLFKDKLSSFSDEEKDKVAQDVLTTFGDLRKGKQAFFIMGPPGAGKSSVIADRLIKTHKAALVDSDIIKEHLPFYGRGEGAPIVNELSGEISTRLFSLCVLDNVNLVYPFVGNSLNKIEERIEFATKNAYSVHLLYVHVPLAVSLNRIYCRWKETGRFVSFEYALALGTAPLQNFKDIVVKRNDLLSSYLFYDNDALEARALGKADFLEFFEEDLSGIPMDLS